MSARIILALGLVVLSIVLAVAESSIEYVVSTPFGKIRGYRLPGQRVVAFHGIPYATPPVKENRFRAPQPVKPWDNTVGTIVPMTSCPQLTVHLGKYITFGTEDCLYMNIFVPLTDKGEMPAAGSLPVEFFIFGGGYVLGSGEEFGLYDGIHLADTHNAVIVTHNYRLSSLGFLALPELQAEDADHSTGNYAIQDQRTALKFVQKAISSFGGDSSRVFLFGESAGAFSTCVHYVSPASAGLFHAAALESGTCDSKMFFVDYDLSVEFSRDWVASVGCPRTGAAALECLRSKTVGELFSGTMHVLSPGETVDALNRTTYFPYADALLEAYPALSSVWAKVGQYFPPLFPVMPFGPTVDGSVSGLQGLPLDLIRGGRFNRVPLIGGTNKDEGTLFLPAMPFIVKGVFFPFSEHSIELLIEHFFNASVSQQILSLYPADAFPSNDARAARIFRDYFFMCSTRAALLAASSWGVPTWMYHYTYPRKGNVLQDILGDYHASELVLVFGNQWPPVLGTFSADDWAVSKSFGSFYANMAKSGNPNGPESLGISWPQYSKDSRVAISVTVPLSIEVNLGEDVCPFWDSFRD